MIRIGEILLVAFILILGCYGAFAEETASNTDGEILLTIPYNGDIVAEYRIISIPLERTDDEYDAQLPDSDNWLICGEGYMVFYFERTELAEDYLPPLSATSMQLFYASGEVVNAIPHEEVIFRLSEEMPENEGLIFLPYPKNAAPPKAARFSYSIREEVPKIYGGSKSVRILEIGEITDEINAEDWK